MKALFNEILIFYKLSVCVQQFECLKGWSRMSLVADFLILYSGAVSGEMFRHMQNSEIIRKMTEEFDEVLCSDRNLSVLCESCGQI